MKKAKDGTRAEYKRSDFAALQRGKFFAEVSKGTAVALLEPPIAKAFQRPGLSMTSSPRTEERRSRLKKRSLA